MTRNDDFMDLFDQLKSLPSRDAVDDKFQHTLDVLAGISMGMLNAQAQELSTDMLNYAICHLIKILSLI